MNTKHIVPALVFSLAVMLLTACEKIAIPREELTDSYDKVYLPAAARNPNMVTLKMTDSVFHIAYGASFGGYGTPAEDIKVEFALDDAKATAFNVANNTSYPLLPASCYEFTQVSAVIPKGAVSTSPLVIKVNPTHGMELFKEYIVAVTMHVNDATKTNESMLTAYYIVKASLLFSDFIDYSKGNWTIAGVSSEEPEEGATNGGMAIHAIDGQGSTFWHTQWNGGYAPPPHWLAIDMKESKTIHGLAFTGRQSTNTGKPNVVFVEVSDNGTDWTYAALLTLANINTEQKFWIASFPQARYVKITVLANFGNKEFTHLAELGVF